jgi:hypothetical protein
MLIDHNCMLSVGCKHMKLITLNMAKTCLKVLELVVVGMGVCFLLEAFACLAVDHLVELGHSEHNHSSFALLNLCVQVIPLSLPAMPMVAICGNSGLLRAGPCTGTHCRCRIAEEGLQL